MSNQHPVTTSLRNLESALMEQSRREEDLEEAKTRLAEAVDKVDAAKAAFVDQYQNDEAMAELVCGQRIELYQDVVIVSRDGASMRVERRPKTKTIIDLEIDAERQQASANEEASQDAITEHYQDRQRAQA